MKKFDSISLEILRIQPKQLESLTEKEQKKLIKQQWGQLALQFHPDKNFSKTASQAFIEINKAYRDLMHSDENNIAYEHEINQYYQNQPIAIPDTAFDLNMQESILLAYGKLKEQFNFLPNNQEKKDFCKRYAPFFNLAQSLEQKEADLNTQRANYLYESENKPLMKELSHEWRKAFISLFAEEYLNDFKYRSALASGALWPILATRKLLSPIKWMSALLQGAYIAFCFSASHFWQKYFQKLFTQFAAVYSAWQNNQPYLKKTSLILLQMATISLSFYVALYCYPALTYKLLSLPLAMTFIKIIGSPVNTIIRPIAQKTHIPPLLLTSLFIALGAATVYLAIKTALLSGVISLLPLLNTALGIYSLYGMSKFTHNCYKISPALGIFQASFMALMFVVGYATPAPNAGAINDFDVFFLGLSNASILYTANRILENIRFYIAEKLEVLPMQNEKVSPAIQSATLLGYKKAMYSHRLFNTPEDANYLGKKDRGFWQQTGCFFGSFPKKPKHPSAPTTPANASEQQPNAPQEEARLAIAL